MTNVNVIEWLGSGGPWDRAPQVVETHAALIFLVGDRAYKLKKPVDLGYLDFTTVERRHAALARELERNARTAPSTYLRLIPIVARDGTIALRGDGTIVDWLLEMRRFADDALLAQLAERGELTETTIEQLAAHIAAFHDAAETIPQYDWTGALARIARENSDDLRAQAQTFRGHDLEAVIAARERAHQACAGILARQAADIRRCHGDMHLGNAFLDGGKPTLFDCIEFDDFYATIPPLYDIAFLLMDLLARGLPRLANRALNVWAIHRRAERWGEIMDGLAALPLYLALRAEIRAKTEARGPGGSASALRYLDLVRVFLNRPAPRLIAVGGLSGTGKSSLAKQLAWQIDGGAGAIHLRSDEIRKRLAGVPTADRLPASAYNQQASDRVYAVMTDLTRHALQAGNAVIVDAVFARPHEREALAASAMALGVPFTGFWLEASRDVLEQRVARRQGDASDADVAVLHAQLTYDLGAIAWQRLDASTTTQDVERAALTRLGLA